MYSMVADVRFDARLALRYADGEKCADGASSRHSFVQFDTDHVNLDAATAAVVQTSATEVQTFLSCIEF